MLAPVLRPLLQEPAACRDLPSHQTAPRTGRRPPAEPPHLAPSSLGEWLDQSSRPAESHPWTSPVRPSDAPRSGTRTPRGAAPHGPSPSASWRSGGSSAPLQCLNSPRWSSASICPRTPLLQPPPQRRSAGAQASARPEAAAKAPQGPPEAAADNLPASIQLREAQEADQAVLPTKPPGASSASSLGLPRTPPAPWHRAAASTACGPPCSAAAAPSRRVCQTGPGRLELPAGA
mmetsp:Transcript_98121/g.233538  ORF Transcript_98121/g.233538 Transcript_98121/m.233538 type:complete len:233 (-) Transcript_98121:1004-1702(-)